MNLKLIWLLILVGGCNSASIKDANDTVSTTSLCPTGYIVVPSNSSYGTSSTFCVAQFEMKNVASVATSVGEGFPWVSIDQASAKAACTSLGAKYDLISNPEWMTIAINLESVPLNWTGEALASGRLFTGHNDGTPASALEVTNQLDGYNGTLNSSSDSLGSGLEQRRYLTLSNGNIIWDFSGNVWEWVDWSLGGALTAPPTTCAGNHELVDVSCGDLSSMEYYFANPGSVSPLGFYDRSYGLGYFLGGSGGSALRGGAFNIGTYSGVFGLLLNVLPTSFGTNIGFRCVYRP